MPAAYYGGRVGTPMLLRGMPRALERMDEAARVSTDLSDAWDVLGAMWASRQRTVFATNGLGRWAPIAKRSMLNGSSEPLVDTGLMFRGLTELRPRFARKRFVAYGPRKYDRRVMNPAVLAASGFHNRGGGVVRSRPPVPKLRPAEKKQWLDAVQRFVNSKLREV